MVGLPRLNILIILRQERSMREKIDVNSEKLKDWQEKVLEAIQGKEQQTVQVVEHMPQEALHQLQVQYLMIMLLLS